VFPLAPKITYMASVGTATLSLRLFTFVSPFFKVHRSAPFATRLASDCGLKYLPREVAFGKLRAMVEGAS
jgi:hypothetical protein